MSQSQQFDASIPVLTEVLWGTPEDAPPAPPLLDHAPASTDASGEQWAALERRLSESILHQVQGSVDAVLSQCLAEVLQGALAKLSGEISIALRNTVEQAVSAAVSGELARQDEPDK
jgi:hypothetical protein